MADLDALWAFLVAGAVALVLTPLAARLAHRVGAIDRPRERSLHDSPTPSLGGLAILAGVLAAGAAFLPWSGETRGILGGAAAITLIGAIDDTLEGGLPPFVKLAASSPPRLSRWPPTCGWRTSPCPSSSPSIWATGELLSPSSGWSP